MHQQEFLMKLMRLDYRLAITYRLLDYRLAGMASITDYDYSRLRLPITITNDYRLRFAAIRLAITISRGPLINTPVAVGRLHPNVSDLISY